MMPMLYETPSKPHILLLSLAPDISFADRYSDVACELFRRSQFQQVSTLRDALDYFRDTVPSAVIVSDGGITKPCNTAVRTQLKNYLTHGGIVIFGLDFPYFVGRSNLDTLFHNYFGLPWKSGDFEETTVFLNLHVADAIPSAGQLVREYDLGALYLKHVKREEALYLPSPDYMVDRCRVRPERRTELDHSPVAWTKLGGGWIGYIGDVNRNPGSDEALFAMCGL
ncbi:hypothetical protein FQN57_004161 [Myotisia sp. PD_48]|nr:hypothetical protein FQN57_004161 [Myotisia sp. PD_48]